MRQRVRCLITKTVEGRALLMEMGFPTHAVSPLTLYAKTLDGSSFLITNTMKRLKK